MITAGELTRRPIVAIREAVATMNEWLKLNAASSRLRARIPCVGQRTDNSAEPAYVESQAPRLGDRTRGRT
jgi:hypothetical protein